MDGSRVVRSAKTRPEAEQKRLELLQSRSEGRLVPGRVPTVGQWLDIWMDTVVRENRARWTVRGYEVVIEPHIKPVLGKVKLDRLTPADVRTWQHKMSRTVNDRTGEVYSGKTIANARPVLHAALQQAVKDGGLGLVRNPADASQGLGSRRRRHQSSSRTRRDGSRRL